MIKKLIVAETFYSLQCEGRAIGTPAVFLRLAGCNLLCESKNWRCDTIEVWQKGKATDFKDVLCPQFIDRLKQGAHLVITGGEPLLHQNKIVDYLNFFAGEYSFIPFVEIETNGTIIPNLHILAMINWWNVSPKLENSGEPAIKRINELFFDAIKKTDHIIKFVIDNEGDILEILQDYQFVDFKKIYLMPAGSSREDLSAVRQTVAELAIKYGFFYSERLHIVIWDKKTGV